MPIPLAVDRFFLAIPRTSVARQSGWEDAFPSEMQRRIASSGFKPKSVDATSHRPWTNDELAMPGTPCWPSQRSAKNCPAGRPPPPTGGRYCRMTHTSPKSCSFLLEIVACGQVRNGLVWDFSCQAGCFWVLLPVLCSERAGRSSFFNRAAGVKRLSAPA